MDYELYEKAKRLEGEISRVEKKIVAIFGVIDDVHDYSYLHRDIGFRNSAKGEFWIEDIDEEFLQEIIEKIHDYYEDKRRCLMAKFEKL